MNSEASSQCSAAANGRTAGDQPVPASPQPGDLILVELSEWYALPDGALLRVCEWAGWVTPGHDIYVAPRSQVRTFWGPDYGAPDGRKRMRMSTSGGPFRTITLSRVAPLERLGTRLDTFWRWLDRPRAGGGLEYQQEVTLWKLPWLPDKETYLAQDQEGRR
jgi:hypothetical protein